MATVIQKYQSYKDWLETLLHTLDIPEGVSYRLYDTELSTLSDDTYTVYTLQIITHYQNQRAAYETLVSVPKDPLDDTLYCHGNLVVHATNLTLLKNILNRNTLQNVSFHYTPTQKPTLALKHVLQEYFYSLTETHTRYTPLTGE